MAVAGVAGTAAAGGGGDACAAGAGGAVSFQCEAAAQSSICGT